MNQDLLILCDLPVEERERFAAAGFRLHLIDRRERERIASLRAKIAGVVTIGTVGLTAAEMELLPELEIVCALGVGYEGIDLEAARKRGIVVANGAGTNADCVADHAMALLLAIIRDVPHSDAAARQGAWREDLPIRPQAAGKRLGLIGLGHIGQAIGARAEGFRMAVGYHTRQVRTDCPYAYHGEVGTLARWADILVVAVPGGAATRHMVDAAVLDALGPRGFLVNVARGSVVDTAALADALKARRIAGAALDVFEDEPGIPEILRDLGNVVVTPHTGGRSPETVTAMTDLAIRNLTAHFSGRPVATPV